MRILCLFVAFALSLSSAFGQNSDIEMLRSINVERNQNLDVPMLIITHSDSPISIGAPAIILTVGLVKKDSLTKQNALMMTGSLLGSTIVMVGMKYGIGRDRPFVTYPEIEKLAPAGSPSFPSGHTSMAFTTATSLSFAYPKWYVIFPSFLWAGSVGYSRMHLGVHYPSDVFVGAIIGSGSAWLSSFLTNRIQENRRRKAPGKKL